MKQENVKNKKENREELVSYIRMGRELSGRQQILLVIQLSLPAVSYTHLDVYKRQL